MEETKFCQCCAMPMGQTDEYMGQIKMEVKVLIIVVIVLKMVSLQLI
ncbi:hypothetical protein QME_0960 [Clostridioides difficile DA00246]|nr:hypothetical protein QME_0960 [Clostridioides difficile DA00246]